MKQRRLTTLRKSSLTIAQLLIWADDHRARTGRLPCADSGPVLADPSENWTALNQALAQGLRGLPGGDTLARLLRRERGHCPRRHQPPLREADILAWADAHYLRTGFLPTVRSGAVEDAPGETWKNLDACLHRGGRSLPGGGSLYRLLRQHGRG